MRTTLEIVFIWIVAALILAFPITMLLNIWHTLTPFHMHWIEHSALIKWTGIHSLGAIISGLAGWWYIASFDEEKSRKNLQRKIEQTR